MITVELITALFSHVDEQLCGAAPEYLRYASGPVQWSPRVPV